MRKSKFYLIMPFLLISSCASQMTQDNMYRYTRYVANVEKCFEDEYMSTQLYAQTKNSLSHGLGTWRYDSNKFASMVASFYSNTTSSASLCRKTEATSYQLIGESKQYSANSRQETAAWNNAIRNINRNKPIICNTTGTITSCF